MKIVKTGDIVKFDIYAGGGYSSYPVLVIGQVVKLLNDTEDHRFEIWVRNTGRYIRTPNQVEQLSPEESLLYMLEG